MLLEFFEDLILQSGGQVFEFGDGLGDLFDLEIRQEFHNIRGVLLPQRDHENGHLLARGEFLFLGVFQLLFILHVCTSSGSIFPRRVRTSGPPR